MTNTSIPNSVTIKRKQTCGKCGGLGHNKRSCKVTINNEETNITPLLIHDDNSIKNSKKLISEKESISQCELVEKLMDDYHYSVIKDIYEKYFIEDDSFNNIDDFKKHFIEKNLALHYPKYNIWYENQEDLSGQIIEYLLQYPKINHIPITAPCGGGKTMSMDSTSKHLMTMPIDDYTKLISINNIFVITGYSSKEWKNDMQNNLNIIKSENVFHRDTIKNLKILILKDYKRLLNAVLFIDEARLVVEEGMTIDIFFKELGLTPDIISQYNIKIFYIDATLDSHNISLSKVKNVADSVFQMEPGDNYIGVEYSMEKWLKDISLYNLKNEIGFNKIFRRIKKLLKKNKKKHLFRITDSKIRKKFIEKINKMSYSYYLVDSSKESHQWGEHSLDEELTKESDNITIYILKDMYRCAKRFRLNKYIGIIYEQATDSDTITTQGIIARFFGYYPDLEEEDINPFMICNKTHFERQIYELKNGEPHPEYKTRYVKGNRLLKPTWNSKMLNSSDNTKRTIQRYFDDGYISSGSICKEFIVKHIEENGTNDKLNKLITCENLMDRCEKYDSLTEIKNRYTELTGKILSDRFAGGTNGVSEVKMNSFGNLNIFSNMSITKDKIDEKFKENNNYIECRIYYYHDSEKKYALRWITKI